MAPSMRLNATSRPPASQTATLILIPSASALLIAASAILSASFRLSIGPALRLIGVVYPGAQVERAIIPDTVRASRNLPVPADSLQSAERPKSPSKTCSEGLFVDDFAVTPLG